MNEPIEWVNGWIEHITINSCKKCIFYYSKDDYCVLMKENCISDNKICSKCKLNKVAILVYKEKKDFCICINKNK